ncbi:MAG: hypothetical protein KF763_00885 [Cyclobacteriaceae bacterium]|nr:hypothetical protein [Cyclobacteriaceae bacterium]
MNSTGTLSEQTGTKYANTKKIQGFSGTENVPITGTKVFRQNRIITIKNGLSVPTCSDFVPAIIGSNRIDKAKSYHFLPEHF